MRPDRPGKVRDVEVAGPESDRLAAIGHFGMPVDDEADIDLGAAIGLAALPRALYPDRRRRMIPELAFLADDAPKAALKRRRAGFCTRDLHALQNVMRPEVQPIANRKLCCRDGDHSGARSDRPWGL